MPVGNSTVGQRQRAVDVVKQSPEGSVGAAVNKTLPFATKLVREMCAGDVGKFYEDNRALLNSPNTEANRSAFAEKETAHFKSAPDCSKLLGGMLTAKDRANMLAPNVGERKDLNPWDASQSK